MILRSARLAALAGVFLACGSSTSGSGSGSASSTAGSASASAAPPAAATPPASADADAAPASCPRVVEPRTTGRIDAPALGEASGLVASATNHDVFWLHNDSGDTARGFAVTRTGTLLATLSFDTVKPTDIEDMAIEDVGPGVSFLYFADIGDNAAARSELTIHRVPEPKLGPAAGQTLTAASEKMRVTYPDGAHDAETLLFDPTTRDLLIATKKLFGGSTIHRVGPFVAGARVTTEKVATVGVSFATGGDISRDGRLVVIRNYAASASLWTRLPGETLAAALARPACTVPVAAEKQGEAIGFLADGTGYATVSEGKSSDLHVAVFQ